MEGFHFHDLLAEMQREVRNYCDLVARSMLSMTCRTEHAVATVDDRLQLLFRLAGSSNTAMEEHLLRILKQPDFGRSYWKRRRQLVQNLEFFWDQLHNLKHEALRSGSFKLIHALITDDARIFEDEGECRTGSCIHLAVARGHPALVDLVATTYSRFGITFSNTATIAALVCNDIPMLQHLQSRGHLVRKPMLEWFGVQWAKEEPWKGYDALRWLANESSLNDPEETCLDELVKHLLVDKVMHQASVTAIRTFVEEELRLESIDWTSVCLIFSLRMLQESLTFKNVEVWHWARLHVKELLQDAHSLDTPTISLMQRLLKEEMPQ